MLTYEEVKIHNTKKSCWVIVSGKVYDITSFIDSHPGGAAAILRWAGKDGTKEYEIFHAGGTIEKTLPIGPSLLLTLSKR